MAKDIKENSEIKDIIKDAIAIMHEIKQGLIHEMLTWEMFLVTTKTTLTELGVLDKYKEFVPEVAAITVAWNKKKLNKKELRAIIKSCQIELTEALVEIKASVSLVNKKVKKTLPLKINRTPDEMLLATTKATLTALEVWDIYKDYVPDVAALMLSCFRNNVDMKEFHDMLKTKHLVLIRMFETTKAEILAIRKTLH